MVNWSGFWWHNGWRVLVVVGGAVFLALTWLVISRNVGLGAADAVGMQLAYGLRSPALTAVMRAVTWLGTDLAYLVVLAAGWPLARRQGAKYLALAMVSLVGADIVRTTVNLLVHRPRPPHAQWLTPASLYSFPSGHTALAGTAFGLAAWLLWRWDRRAGRWAVAGGLVAGLAVACSRVYLGVHWPSDVLGGAVFALVWTCLTILVARRIVAP